MSPEELKALLKRASEYLAEQKKAEIECIKVEYAELKRKNELPVWKGQRLKPMSLRTYKTWRLTGEMLTGEKE
jgi:hypothetical protein